MKRRLLIGLAVLGVCALAWLVAIRRNRADTLYHGKPLKGWALQLYAPGPEVREQAAAVFRAMGANAVPGLIQLLDSRDPFWRKQLWRVGLSLPSGFRPGLLRHSPVPQDETVHQAAAMALKIIGPDAKAAIPTLARALRSKDRAARWAVASAMASIGKDSVPALIDALSDRDPEVRAAAIAGLDMLGPGAQAAVPVLFERLQDENADVRLRAGNALSAIGPAAAPILINAVMREKGIVRQGAAKVLMSMPSSRRAAEPALLEMLLDVDPSSRTQAIDTLAAIHAADQPAIAAMIAALKDPVPNVRLAAANALGQVKLLRLSNDPDPSVSAAAKEALAKMQARQGN